MLVIIVLIFLLSKGWVKVDSWFYKKLDGRWRYKGQFTLMSGLIFFLLLSGVVAITYTYHFQLLNTMFISRFFLVLPAVVAPFLARQVLNTETVHRRYISSSASADRGLSLPFTQPSEWFS
ncbi:hypothetical protein Q0N12_17430 [Rossellomorea marisflavi]|uniref:hypothetical protein n=1 Tax=Rossellomorea marisflavi TaxID=189381 RepID=UPI0034574DBA